MKTCGQYNFDSWKNNKAIYKHTKNEEVIDSIDLLRTNDV